MAQRYNDYEEDILELADEYVAMVGDFLKELAPVRPFWTVPLGSEAALYRYMEIREKIVPWLAEAGAYMGFKSWSEVLANLPKFWFGHLLEDTTPTEVIVRLPVELRSLVQANPNDAAGYLRKMESIFEKKMADVQTLNAQEAVVPPAIIPGPLGAAGGVAEPAPLGRPVPAREIKPEAVQPTAANPT